MLLRSVNLRCSGRFGPIVFQTTRCSATSGSHEPALSASEDSSSFRNNLRKGFAPLKKEKIIAAKKAKPPVPADGEKLTVLGGDEFSVERWREVDKKMNKYPGKRTFTAIGTGGPEFSASMVRAVESVMGLMPPDCVLERPSSGGAYVSVKLGPVTVETPDQVVAIFANMKTDPRLKWFM